MNYDDIDAAQMNSLVQQIHDLLRQHPVQMSEVVVAILLGRLLAAHAAASYVEHGRVDHEQDYFDRLVKLAMAFGERLFPELHEQAVALASDHATH